MPATAENPFDFASTPGKLAKEVAPTEYSIRIVPNVEARTFSGTAIIKVNATKPVRQLVMNALELDVSGAMVDDEALPASAIKVDRKQELLILSLLAELPPGLSNQTVQTAMDLARGGTLAASTQTVRCLVEGTPPTHPVWALTEK